MTKSNNENPKIIVHYHDENEDIIIPLPENIETLVKKDEIMNLFNIKSKTLDTFLFRNKNKKITMSQENEKYINLEKIIIYLAKHYNRKNTKN